MVQRVLISADRVAVSRPGYDVVSSPSTPDYMAIDSAFVNQPRRLLLAGSIQGPPKAPGITVTYGTIYAAVPYVLIYNYLGGGTPVLIQNSQYKYTKGNDIFGNELYIDMYRDKFSFSWLLQDATVTDYLGDYNQSRIYQYFVFDGS